MPWCCRTCSPSTPTPHRDAAARVATALDADADADGAVAGLLALYADLDAPTALRDLGLGEDDLDEATERVVAAAPADNPGPRTPPPYAACCSGPGPAPSP